MEKRIMADVQQALNAVAHKPLQKITRAADLICFQFGDLLKTQMPVRNAEGKLVPGEGLIGEYALQVACCGRLICGDTVIFANADLYQPSAKALAALGLQPDDALPDDFNYGIVGNNRLDEIIHAQFSSVEGFTVASISISRIGDLHIRFSNGFQFQALIDVSGPEECWRFFKWDADEHMVMTGEGLAVDGGE